tara:strand:- start:379 stop:681 length:303 start_codon:yes stop_codon:yes gene_type:complete
MVSRKQYNEALDIVEAYQKQLFKSNNGVSLREAGKTPFLEWVNSKNFSTRLNNALLHMSYFKEEKWHKVEYLEDINKLDFLRHRNIGKKGWHDFVEIRGY